MAEKVRIKFDGDRITMAWDGAQASAPIVLDGAPTQYQTADARHDRARAVRLMAKIAWPEEDWDSAEDRCAWDELEYESV